MILSSSRLTILSTRPSKILELKKKEKRKRQRRNLKRMSKKKRKKKKKLITNQQNQRNPRARTSKISKMMMKKMKTRSNQRKKHRAYFMRKRCLSSKSWHSDCLRSFQRTIASLCLFHSTKMKYHSPR